MDYSNQSSIGTRVIIVAVVADIGMYVGGGYGHRDRIPGYGG